VGIRVSKSLKVAPGVRVRVNSKSTSVSFGGKGMRYTVNSKGKRTTTVRVPGTGVYAQRVSGTTTRKSVPRVQTKPPQVHSNPPRQSLVAARTVPKPGLFAPKGEKLLCKILAAASVTNARRASQCEQVAEKFPEQRIAAATMAGLFALTDAPSVSIRALEYVADSGVEIADEPFLRRYAPVTAYSMEAGGGERVWIPLSRELVIMWLATVHLVAGDLDRAEATAAALKDTPAARELRRKITAVRARGQTQSSPVIAPAQPEQAELLERLRSGLADVMRAREAVQNQIAALEQMVAKLEVQVGRARHFGREDLAQQAIAQQQAGRRQIDQLRAQNVQLTTDAQRLQAKIDSLAGSAMT
jgi:hypothetical protein